VARSSGRLELGQELAAEDRGEDPHGQKTFQTAFPAISVWRAAS
jgi:hypothetical protein